VQLNSTGGLTNDTGLKVKLDGSKLSVGANGLTIGTLTSSDIPSLDASKITSGTLSVANGGTGVSSVTADSYLKGNGTEALVERTYTEVKTDLSLNNVENTALSTWTGTSSITTLGTISSGTWNGTDVAVADGGTGASDAAGAKTNLGFMTDVVDDTTPQLGGMLDINGNALGDGSAELLKFAETPSAVNEITIKNAATSNAPEIQATGDDTDVDIKLVPQGSGNVVLSNLKYPNADGSNEQVLKTDGNGNLSWEDDTDTNTTYSADDSTLTLGGTTFSVKNDGITASKIASAVAGDGLAGGGGSALAVNVDASTLEISSDTVKVKDAGITENKLAASLTFDDGDLLDLSSITADSQTEGLKLPVYDADATADGQISWDATNDTLYVGTDGSQKTIATTADIPSTTGMVTETGTQTLTNKTLTSPTINAASLSGTLSGTPSISGNWVNTASSPPNLK